MAVRNASTALCRGKLVRQASAVVRDGERPAKGLISKALLLSRAPIAADLGNTVMPNPRGHHMT